MKKRNAILCSVLALVVVGAIVFTQTDLLAGRFGRLDFSKIYLYEGEYVSVVVTPVTSTDTSEVSSEVTSEVSSEVTSSGGTSIVTSEVPSTVTSEVPSTYTTPVASAVAVSESVAAQAARRSDIKDLTAKILENAARKDFKSNPAKYILTDAQRQTLIELYNEEHRS